MAAPLASRRTRLAAYAVIAVIAVAAIALIDRRAMIRMHEMEAAAEAAKQQPTPGEAENESSR